MSKRRAENEPMMRAEIHDLMSIVKRNAKVRRLDIEALGAAFLAKIEEQLAAVYPADHAAFQDLGRQAEELVKKVDAEVAKRCKTMGIPARFRPSVSVGWYGRGENAVRERRKELRDAAEARVEAMMLEAKKVLLRNETQQLNELTAEGITSERAQKLLASLPTAEQLLPALTLAELEKEVPLLEDDSDGN